MGTDYIYIYIWLYVFSPYEKNNVAATAGGGVSDQECNDPVCHVERFTLGWTHCEAPNICVTLPVYHHHQKKKKKRTEVPQRADWQGKYVQEKWTRNCLCTVWVIELSRCTDAGRVDACQWQWGKNSAVFVLCSYIRFHSVVSRHRFWVFDLKLMSVSTKWGWVESAIAFLTH